MLNSMAAYGFSAEYEDLDSHHHEELDEYLRNEFAAQGPRWQASFGTTAFFKPEVHDYDYRYLLTGDVPEAGSKPEAEKKVREFIDDLESKLKAHRPDLHGALKKPKIRVWHW